MRLILIWCCNALALLAVAYVLPGVRVDGFGSALIAALVLGLINTMIRPVLLLLTLPVTVLSLGLFIFVINGLLFWFAGSLLRGWWPVRWKRIPARAQRGWVERDPSFRLPGECRGIR